MTITVNTVIIGGGQAGLSVSHYMMRHNQDHLVLEQSDAAGDAWRNHRWDSFTLNTPRWQSRLPGACTAADDPDAFMSREEIVGCLEQLARPLPVRYGMRVSRVERNRSGQYVLDVDGGETIRARNVVVATGLYQTPTIPASSASFPADIRQLHSDAYRNPQQLLPGAVLVVGSAQSGAQIAEELYESGRKVYLAVSRAGRMPRRYRGRDANWWSAKLGLYDRKVSDLPSRKAKFTGKPHISGTRGGHTLNLHQFARDGVVLLGRLSNVEDGMIRLAPDLQDNLAAADRCEADFTRAVDCYVERTGMTVPQEKLPALGDGFAQPVLRQLDLRAAGIANVIWATGYRFDFSMIKLPILDDDGYPIQTRGVTAYPGLFFVGLPWLHDAKSGLIYGVGGDASYIADRIAARQNSEAAAPAREQPKRAGARANPTLGFILQGFAAQAAGLRSAAAPARFPAIIESDAEPERRPLRRNSNPLTVFLPMECNMQSKLFVSVAVAVLVNMSLPSMAAAAQLDEPIPPRVEFATIPAGQLKLGMTEQEATRIMGEPTRIAGYDNGGINARKLEFSGAIPTKVTLSDGKVSRVALDVFQVEKGDLPPFSRKAWPGTASMVVRRALGEPGDIRHYSFFGIKLDQWVYDGAGGPEVSIFFAADRVIAKTIGRRIPQDIFQVRLPAPPQPHGETEVRGAQVGMSMSDIQALYREVKFRVDYVFNGQPAVRAIYETSARSSFVSLTFVDDRVVEAEDLGTIRDWSVLEGR